MNVQLIIRRNSKATEHAIDLASFDAKSEFRIGRDSRNDIQIPLPFFSSQHLRIFAEGSQWYAEDLGSTNGTVYRGRRLEPGTSSRWEMGEPLIVQDLELTLKQDRSQVTIAHTSSLARRLLVDDANLNSSDLAFFEVQNGPQTGQRFSLADDFDSFCFEVSADTIREDATGNLAVLREGDGFALTSEVSIQCNGAPYVSGSRIPSGTRVRHGALELLFYDPIEDLLPSPPNPLQTHDVSLVEPPTDLSNSASNDGLEPAAVGNASRAISQIEYVVLAVAIVAILVGLTVVVVLFV